MSIRNRISVGWLTAQAERLKRFIALSKDDPVAKTRQPPCSTRHREAAKQSRGLGRFWIASPLQPSHLRDGRNSPHATELVNVCYNDSDETIRTFWLGSSFCTPSATILAPSSTPLVMTTSLLS